MGLQCVNGGIIPCSGFELDMCALHSGKWREGRTQNSTSYRLLLLQRLEMNLAEWLEFHVCWVLYLCKVTSL